MLREERDCVGEGCACIGEGRVCVEERRMCLEKSVVALEYGVFWLWRRVYLRYSRWVALHGNACEGRVWVRDGWFWASSMTHIYIEYTSYLHIISYIYIHIYASIYTYIYT